MKRKKKSRLRVDEIWVELFEHDEEQIDNADVGSIPPDVDELTGQDEASDDNMGESTVQDVPGTLELHIDSKILPKTSCSSGNPDTDRQTETGKRRSQDGIDARKW